MKIEFAGTHSTGKTTIVNQYKEKYPVVTNIVRNLFSKGIKINELGDEEGQKIIFNSYYNIFSGSQDYISDSGLINTYAYSKFHNMQNKMSKKELEREKKICKKYIIENNVLICYFPIEFDLVEDGIRSSDRTFRNFIDLFIKEILDELKINYITIHGTIEERKKQLDSIIYKKFIK